MSATDEEVAGIFDAIDTEASAHEPVEQNKVSETEGSDSTSETSTENTTEAATTETGSSAEGQTQPTETQTEVGSQEHEHSQTENTEQDFSNWKESLPPEPQPYAGPKPEFDEAGVITNMDPQQYEDYITAKAEHAMETKQYYRDVENKALEVAEKILPEIKTNQGIRQMVEDARVASILSGKPIDSVEAAKRVRDAIGIAPEKLAAAKTEGANSAKASITIQENAALETGSSQKRNTEQGDKVTELQNRVKRGDSDAFAELLGVWQEQGLIN